MNWVDKRERRTVTFANTFYLTRNNLQKEKSFCCCLFFNVKLCYHKLVLKQPLEANNTNCQINFKDHCFWSFFIHSFHFLFVFCYHNACMYLVFIIFFTALAISRQTDFEWLAFALRSSKIESHLLFFKSNKMEDSKQMWKTSDVHLHVVSRRH